MPTDILFNNDGDINLDGGDIHFGDSTEQHKYDMLLSRKGDIRRTPAVGVGVLDFAKDDDVNDMSREIRVQLSKDGMTVNSIAMSGTIITIDGNYKNSQ